MFQGPEGVVQTQSVDVVNTDEKPLDVKPGSFNLSDKMTYRIEEVQKGKVFRVYFTTLSNVAGSFNGFLALTTNHDDAPEMRVLLNGNFQKNTETNEKR
jgi:hypothetical protein